MAARVLVVDDDQAILDLLKYCLEDDGYDVHLRSELDGIDSVIQQVRPTCLVIDHMFTDARAVGVIARLRGAREAAHLRVVVCSAATDQIRLHSRELEAFGTWVVPKPFDIDLVGAIRRCA